jgi:hypothetical protein
MLAIFAALNVAPAAAQTLYTSTMRAYVGPGEVVGKLYIVDPATAATRFVGPLRIGEGGAHIGITGLAVHPKTGVMYGITAGVTPSLRPSLVTIDPKTAQATLVGTLGHSASDINFDSSGRLFVWLTDLDQLGSIDLAKGAAVPLGPASTNPASTGGGLAIDGRGIAHIAATTAAGTLDKLDVHTGVRTVGPVLTGARYLSAIHSLTFSPSGVLYGVNTNLAAPAKTALVTIDAVSGVISLVGDLPEDADGLTFSPDVVAAVVETSKSRHLAYWALAIAALLGVVVIVVLTRRGKSANSNT